MEELNRIFSFNSNKIFEKIQFYDQDKISIFHSKSNKPVHISQKLNTQIILFITPQNNGKLY